MGRGRSRCWSSPVSGALTEFSHGPDPSHMPDAPVISDRTPLSGPQSQDVPASTTTELMGGGGGGYQGEEKKLDGGGGLCGKTHVLCLKYLLSE